MTIQRKYCSSSKLLKWNKEEKEKKAKELINLVDLPELFRFISLSIIWRTTTTYRCR